MERGGRRLDGRGAGAGLDETFLQNPPDYPLDDQARASYIRAGYQPSSIAMNCSTVL